MPYINNSRGRTRIALEGSVIWGLPAPRPKEKPGEDHGYSYGVIYANDAAARVMLAGGPQKYPAGSVIVREKLSRPEATKPELLAAMIKRAPGFNPAGGDWEFLLFDGALTRVRERQKKGSCLECHASQAARDFVYPPPRPRN